MWILTECQCVLHQVTRHYKHSSATFRSNPLRTPSLVFYSTADVVAVPGPIDSLISTWRGHGVPVYCRRWNDSRHVTHYRSDPVNYAAELEQFLHSVGLVSHHDDDDDDDDDVDSKKVQQQSMWISGVFRGRETRFIVANVILFVLNRIKVSFFGDVLICKRPRDVTKFEFEFDKVFSRFEICRMF